MFFDVVKKKCLFVKDFLNVKDVEDSIVLYVCCWKGVFKVVELLLCYGVDYEVVIGVNFSIFFYFIVMYGYEEIIKLLFICGVDIFSKDGYL